MKSYLITVILISINGIVSAQSSPQTSSAESELKHFFESYADDLKKKNVQAIINRYDTTGYYRMGNGNKKFVSFADLKAMYTNRWTGPKSFAWKNLSYDVLSQEVAVVTGLFDWQIASGDQFVYSYTGVLRKIHGQWKIRLEDESASALDYTVQSISGNSNVPGPFKYSLKARSGASMSAQKYSTDMKVTVISGRKYILMGDLEKVAVQKFDAGTSFTIPANTWHVQWWETETLEEIEGTGPMKTVRANPLTPRTN